MRSTILFVSLLLLGTSHAAGQAPWIIINEPVEWSDTGTVTVPSGTRIRIIGQAYHPKGIQSINIASKNASLRQQSNGVVDFDVAFSVIPLMKSVRVVAQVVGGDTLTKDLKLTVTIGHQAQPQAQLAPAPAPDQSGGSAIPARLPYDTSNKKRWRS